VDKKTRRRVKGIAIFIVFLAVGTSIIQWQGKAGKQVNYNFKPSAQKYSDLQFINKAQVSLSSLSIHKAQTEMTNIIAQHSSKQIRKQNEGSFGAYIFSVPQKDLPTIVDKMRGFGSVGSQTEQIDTSLVNIDFDGETARLASYEREQADLGNVRFPSDVQNRRKEALHSLIQNTRNNLEKLKEANNVLLYVTLVPQVRSSNTLNTIKVMGFNFLTWLVIYAVGMVLVYYGTRLLMYFLAALGIKGISAGGVGGSYQYGGYTGYANKYAGRYGYNTSKRKIKRVYKEKTSDESSEPEDKS